MNTSQHVKAKVSDVEIIDIADGEDLSQHELTRAYAVKKTFVNVKFKQCLFASCYFRNCRFIGCDFTGTLFKETNLDGAQFENCKFHYTQWEKTLIDQTILGNCLPAEENLAQELVRRLRVNFSQIGNQDGVNKAARMEVQLTGMHLFNAAYSPQSYYRAKYKGWTRVEMCIRHASWKLSDLVWGNGESLFKVVLMFLIVISVFSAIFQFVSPDQSFSDNLMSTINTFWGIKPQAGVLNSLQVLLTIMRFTLFGLFMTVLVRRMSKR